MMMKTAYCSRIVLVLLLCLTASHLVAGFSLLPPLIQPCCHGTTQHRAGSSSSSTSSTSYPMATNNHNHDEHGLFGKVQQTGLVVSLTLLWCLSSALLLPLSAAHAADFAGMDISGQDFSNQDLQGKDFTSVVAKGTKFQGANLQGATFVKANLMQADFTGANLGNAILRDAILDGSIMKDVIAIKTTFSNSILDVADFENADLTDSMWPSNLRIMICDMKEIKGTNKVTGVNSIESLMCIDYTRRS